MNIFPDTICNNCKFMLKWHTSEQIYYCAMILLRTYTKKPKWQWNGHHDDLELCPLCNLEFSEHQGLEIMDCVKKLIQARNTKIK